MKKDMKQLQESVLHQALRIQLPLDNNYHNGLRSPELPDNILCFWHNFPFSEIQHNRYCIVIAFDCFEYILNGTPLNIDPGMAIIQRPYASHSMNSRQHSCRRLHISFELEHNPDYLPERNVIAFMSAEAWRKAEKILRLFRKGDASSCALEVYRLCLELKGTLPPTNAATPNRYWLMWSI